MELTLNRVRGRLQKIADLFTCHLTQVVKCHRYSLPCGQFLQEIRNDFALFFCRQLFGLFCHILGVKQCFYFCFTHCFQGLHRNSFFPKPCERTASRNHIKPSRKPVWISQCAKFFVSLKESILRDLFSDVVIFYPSPDEGVYLLFVFFHESREGIFVACQDAFNPFCIVVFHAFPPINNIGL